MEENTNEFYDQFIRQGIAAGFTDDQIDFLWEQLLKLALLKDPRDTIIKTL